jgi:L-threonylcarbamoyladenylate synthase
MDLAKILPFTGQPSPHVIQQVVDCVKANGVLALPTDSFYAMAVGVSQESALERLLRIKGGREGNPIPVLVGDPSQLEQLTDQISDIAWTLIGEFWPGLLTLVLPARQELSSILTGGQPTIGVRQPNDPRVCELLKHTGPLTGTSANRSGQPPAQSAEEVMTHLGSDIDLILDGGPSPGGQPSTVLQLVVEPRIIRQGAISRDRLYQKLQKRGRESF